MSAWLYGPGASPANERFKLALPVILLSQFFSFFDVRLLTPRMAALRTLKTTPNSLKSTRSLLFNHDRERHVLCVSTQNNTKEVNGIVLSSD